jgi:hypothetical protein
MTEDMVHLALFKEDAVDDAAEAIERLRQLGIKDKDMSVISGVPYSEKILGRPMVWTRIPLIAISGAVLGALTSLFLNLGTPLLYPVRVGGMPFLPIPPTIVITFELGMLGLMLATFLGVFIETLTPSYGPKGYHPKISDGYIGILFTCPGEIDTRMHGSLTDLGAELVHASEVKQS